ncbi:MAG: hypothetical protein KAW02_01920 [candidate division Zixibacteria bacterium]|nr:hypothetical protein [candidate division Zixibacteria bacterium]
MSDQSAFDDDRKTKASRYLQQRKYEDQLLYTRMNVVLTVNGLAAIAVGLEGITPWCRLCIAIIVLIMNILWLLCSTEGADFIRTISRELKVQQLREFVPEEQLRIDFLKSRPLSQFMRKRNLLPTTVMGYYIPCLVTLGWFLGLVIVFFVNVTN